MKTENEAIKLPPEWSRQSGIMLTWPHQHSIWLPYLTVADETFVEITRHISHYEKVLIAYFDESHREHIQNKLKSANLDFSQLHFFPAKSNDIWARDHGPITVLDQHDKPILSDFEFNAWGQKYSYNHDNALTKTLAQQGAFGDTPLQKIDFVLEGGAIEVDGQGTLLTTENVMLAKTRNQMDKAEIATIFNERLGIKRVLWLKHGHLIGDDTDGHIDTLVRFVDAHTLCYVSCNDSADEHYIPLQAMREELLTYKDYQGNAYRLIALPMPAAQYSATGQRLPATYANFLIINDAVLMPIYGDEKNDMLAVKILQECFPKRKIVAINCRALINLYGSLHCATMQLPMGVLC